MKQLTLLFCSALLEPLLDHSHFYLFFLFLKRLCSGGKNRSVTNLPFFMATFHKFLLDETPNTTLTQKAHKYTLKYYVIGYARR